MWAWKELVAFVPIPTEPGMWVSRRINKGGLIMGTLQHHLGFVAIKLE